MSRKALVVVSCLTLPIPGGAQTGPPQVHRTTKWNLTAKQAEPYARQPPGEAGYWLGVKNLAAAPQAVCVLSLDYDLIHPQHGSGGMVEGFSSSLSPHSCNTPKGTNLVLPGETLFFYGAIQVPSWADARTALTFSASLREFPSGEWLIVDAASSLPTRETK